MFHNFGRVSWIHPGRPDWNFPYEHTTEFVSVTEPAWLPGSYEEALGLSGIPATLEPRKDRSLDCILARRMTRISAAKIICIHNKLIKSQSPHKVTHFRGQLLQLRDIFRFFDFLFGGSLMALVLFSFNRNAAFFTNVSLAKSVSAMWFKDRPRLLYIITLHLSEIAKYVVIITERLYLIQRWVEHRRETEMNTTIAMDTFYWRPPKLSFWNGKKIVEGRVWLVTAVKVFYANFLTNKTCPRKATIPFEKI